MSDPQAADQPMVYVVSHHEGLVAVAATEELADRILEEFVARHHHLFGKPWVECVRVWDDRDTAALVTQEEK